MYTKYVRLWWDFLHVLVLHGLVVCTEAKGTRFKGHERNSVGKSGKIPGSSWTRNSGFVEESNQLFQSTSKPKNKLQRSFNTNDPLLHDPSDLPVIVMHSGSIKEQFKSSETTAERDPVANQNSKRQYIYGGAPEFRSGAYLPRRDFVTYPTSGIRRGACAHHVCFHGGVCVRTMRGLYCDCSEEYIGVHCEFKRACLENPCKNGGTCTELGQGDISCTCPVGSNGKTCERKDFCVPNPCNNEGLCTDMEDGYHCTCKVGFKGDRCQTKALCYPNPCKNGGTCIDQEDRDFQCSCAFGYKGDLCEISSECKVDPCMNGGTCYELANGYRCACLKGFVGKSCEQTLCSPNPCANGGLCKVSGDHYSCGCAKHYVGKNCEVLNPCLNSPCLNGGKCIVTRSSTSDVNDSFSCKCLRGYYGNMCQMK